jgi:hypothetical protein
MMKNEKKFVRQRDNVYEQKMMQMSLREEDNSTCLCVFVPIVVDFVLSLYVLN